MQIRAPWRPGRRTLIGGGVAIALLVAFALVLVPELRRGATERADQDRERQAELVAAEVRRLAPGARAHTATLPRRASGQAPLAYRRVLVRRAQTLITADARARVRSHEFKGPVGGTSCSPYPSTAARAALELKEDAVTRRYDCVAFRYRFALPELEGRARTGVLGTPFWAVIDDRRASVTWCKISPPPGEGGGKPLAAVAVPAACRRTARPS